MVAIHDEAGQRSDTDTTSADLGQLSLGRGRRSTHASRRVVAGPIDLAGILMAHRGEDAWWSCHW